MPAAGGVGPSASPPSNSAPAQRQKYCKRTVSSGPGDSTYDHSWRSNDGCVRIVLVATLVVSSTDEAKTNCCRRTRPSLSVPRRLSAVSEAMSSCTASGSAKTALAREFRSSSSRMASILASKCS